MRNVVLVCGGRNYGRVPANTPTHKLEEAQDKADQERQMLFDFLDLLHKKRPITLIVQGYAEGADKLAHEWSVDRGVRSTGTKYRITSSMWNKMGKGAGFIRNKKMRDEQLPDLVVAFPGGNGTANMVRIAERAGTNVYVVNEEGIVT
jgi:hypothetical protein